MKHLQSWKRHNFIEILLSFYIISRTENHYFNSSRRLTYYWSWLKNSITCIFCFTINCWEQWIEIDWILWLWTLLRSRQMNLDSSRRVCFDSSRNWWFAWLSFWSWKHSWRTNDWIWFLGICKPNLCFNSCWYILKNWSSAWQNSWCRWIESTWSNNWCVNFQGCHWRNASW